MLKIFLSSTYQDLGEARSEILKQIDSAFAGVGMEEFIPDGTSSHEVCIKDLKKSKIVIFLLSSNYGSLIDKCQLKEGCKADCIMKKGEGKGYQISYTHCEYKTTIAEGILHQTYKVLDGWDTQERPEIKHFEEEFGKEMWTRIPDINDPTVVPLICNNLATKIVEWHTHDKLDFKKFVDREKVLNEIIDNIESKIEIWGVGGVGKTALIQVALLVQKLKGKNIVTIGTIKTYKSGSGFEDFRKKLAKDQYITESEKEITIYDVVKALEKVKLIPNAEEIITSLVDKNKIRESLSRFLREEENLIVFIDDFHLATETVVDLVKSMESIILSSRKNSYIAKDICLTGIDEEDREDLINLFSIKQIPENASKLIKKIAEGHPVSTELLVKNYNDIDFEKIKDFDLKDADDEQVTDFYKRVIEEIFSKNLQALIILKDLAVLNTALPTNIDKESVLNSYNFENVRKIFKTLGDTGMLTKKEGKEGTYEFSFKHIQDAIEDSEVQQNHDKALEYYESKKSILGADINDSVEVLYHRLKAKHSHKKLKNQFNEIKDKLHPTHYGFKRLLLIGEELKNLLNNEEKPGFLYCLGLLYWDLKRYGDTEQSFLDALKIIQSYNPNDYDSSVHQLIGIILHELGSLYVRFDRFQKAEQIYLQSYELFKNLNLEIYANDELILDIGLETTGASLGALGDIYFQMNRFEESEQAYSEALDIFKKLVEKCGPEAYISRIADTYISLGDVYEITEEVKKAEEIYLKALNIYTEEAKEDPEDLDNVAHTKILLGDLYVETERNKEAEQSYKDALKIRKKLVSQFQDKYMPQLAGTHNELGNFYNNSERFEEAEFAFHEALKIGKELAEKSPETYLPDLSKTHNYLGILYINLGRIEKAEQSYLEALRIRKDLVEKYHEVYSPQLAKTQYDLGDFYSDLERFEEAEYAYLEALKIRKDLTEKNPELYLAFEETQHKLVNFYFKLGKPEAGIKILDDSLELFTELAAKNPDKFNINVVNVHDALGVIFYNMGRFKDAIERFDKALEIDPEYIDAWGNKGASLVSLKKYDEAAECYDKSLEIDANFSRAWYNKACLESLRSNKEDSIKFLKKAISLEKTYNNDAKTDEDFDNIRNSKQFKELIEK